MSRCISNQQDNSALSLIATARVSTFNH